MIYDPAARLIVQYTLFTGGIPNPWTVITAEENLIHLSE
jgi:hypothetical protein